MRSARPATLAAAQLRTMVGPAAVSAFMNNAPVVALMVPAIRDWAKKHRLAVSKLLMPMNDAVVLGGLAETELSPLQLHALRDYVEQGGHLIVLPTAAPGVSPALAEMLPGAFISPQRVETMPAVAGGFVFTNGLAVARLIAERGEILFGKPESPWD